MWPRLARVEVRDEPCTVGCWACVPGGQTNDLCTRCRRHVRDVSWTEAGTGFSYPHAGTQPVAPPTTGCAGTSRLARLRRLWAGSDTRRPIRGRRSRGSSVPA